MIASVFKYSSVNVKARALYSKLLTNHDYEELLEKRDVHEVAGYLKKKAGYSSLLSEVNENRIHRGELEQIFKISLYKDYSSLLRFFKGPSKKFLLAAFSRFEVEDLKMLFRIVYNGDNSIALKNSLVFLKSYSNLDFTRLIKSKTISEVIEGLKGSEYFKVMQPFLEVKKRQNLFDIEMSLDLHHFMEISRLNKKLLTGADKIVVAKTLGTEIDISNILMISRCKKLFNFSKERVFKYVVPYWFHLTRKQLINISESIGTDGFYHELSKTAYATIFKPGEEHLWETESMNHLHRVYKSHLHKDMLNLGTVVSYLHLKEMDIKNIIALIEGIRYSLPKVEIRSYLTGIDL